VSRLFDWMLGRGSNPLAPPGSVATGSSAPSPTPEPRDEEAERLAIEADVAMQQQARTLGVDIGTLVEMLDQRELFVAKVQAEPQAWGFDLAPPEMPRRDLAAEYRRATRLTGSLGESFLVGYEPLVAAAPDPLNMPDEGMTLPRWLERKAGLEPDAARDIAQQLRVTIQVTLGQPLTASAVEHAVREAAWDHDLDAAHWTPLVVHALADVLTSPA
jgi:hypothetical protein